MNKEMENWEEQDGVSFLRRIGLQLNQRVLDFGCRVGRYSIPAAQVVGNNGTVYAVDKEQQALDGLEQKASRLHLENIRTINSPGQIQIDLENDSIDVVLFYDVLHYFKEPDRKGLYHETFRVLRQDGLLSVYPKHTLEDEPTQEFERLRTSDVKREIEDAHFVFEQKFCGMISHDDGLNNGCVLNFRKAVDAT